MEGVVGYKTKDGTFFTSYLEALQHETYLNLREFCHDGDEDCDWFRLVSHAERTAEILKPLLEYYQTIYRHKGK